MKKNRLRVMRMALFVIALAALGLAGSASAKLVGEFTKFQQCPWATPEVKECLYVQSEAGEVRLDSITVPVEKQAVLQGGLGEPVKGVSAFFAAKNGVTLSKTAQPLGGGLLGLVPTAKSPVLIKGLAAFFVENALTGVTATLELAQAASNIEFSRADLIAGEGLALKIPVKVHLENPFLGKSCVVGSSGTPLIWELTTGTTAPPKPNLPISGNPSESEELLEEEQILKLSGNVLVDNEWSAPGVDGCGGGLSFLIDPIVASQLGLTIAGRNTAILRNTVYLATAAAVKLNNEDH
jgi:hypothetical protein